MTDDRNFFENRRQLHSSNGRQIHSLAICCEDGGKAKTRDLLYVVEELSSVFISREALSNLGISRKEFPKVPSNSSFGWVAGVQGSSADTAIDQTCIKPNNFSGETADCGCPLRVLPPKPL